MQKYLKITQFHGKSQRTKKIERTWDFSNMQPAIERQNPKIQKIARLFIDYFEKRMNLQTLKSELAKLEKN